MLLRDLVVTSAALAATRSRKEKAHLIRDRFLAAVPEERALVARYLSGRLRQRRTGLGWRGLRDLPAPAPTPTLTVTEVDLTFEEMAECSGPGSNRARAALVSSLFGRATAEEQHWLRAVALGEVRQGALEAVVVEGLALAAAVPVAAVRRAAMLAGGAVYVVENAFVGIKSLERVGLTVGRPVLPMLASSAPDVATALAKTGHARPGDPATWGVDAKLDGIRIQVHRDGEQVLVATRSLDDITDRLPDVVALARSLVCTHVVLDGEAMAVDGGGAHLAFQDTAARTATRSIAEANERIVAPYFFDILHLDGTDLIDEPASHRWQVLENLVPPAHRVRRWIGSTPDEAQAFADEVLTAGYEGVVVKDPAAPYDAGRRGAAWVKVKPVHTLDLVVLAVEHGSGRRQGWLSNIHLGARDPDSPTGFTMLGKTFKGMTDEMLRWQTERFRELEVSDDGWVVTVRPEQVVEIAFDGVQRSTRYPGGVALRFARVVRYRDDKGADEADTIDTLRAHLPPL